MTTDWFDKMMGVHVADDYVGKFITTEGDIQGKHIIVSQDGNMLTGFTVNHKAAIVAPVMISLGKRKSWIVDAERNDALVEAILDRIEEHGASNTVKDYGLAILHATEVDDEDKIDCITIPDELVHSAFFVFTTSEALMLRMALTDLAEADWDHFFSFHDVDLPFDDDEIRGIAGRLLKKLGDVGQKALAHSYVSK